MEGHCTTLQTDTHYWLRTVCLLKDLSTRILMLTLMRIEGYKGLWNVLQFIWNEVLEIV